MEPVVNEGQPVGWETPSWMPPTNGWVHDLPRDRWELWQGGEMVAWLACELLESMGLADNPAEAMRRMAG